MTKTAGALRNEVKMKKGWYLDVMILEKDDRDIFSCDMINYTIDAEAVVYSGPLGLRKISLNARRKVVSSQRVNHNK